MKDATRAESMGGCSVALKAEMTVAVTVDCSAAWMVGQRGATKAGCWVCKTDATRVATKDDHWAADLAEQTGD